MTNRTIYLFTVLFLIFSAPVLTQDDDGGEADLSGVVKGLELRNIGPAFTSGRIADIAVHPDDENMWYVAVGSGGVWKTVNAGVTWDPIFDRQSSYSIGCITIDPNNPHTIWVGTGENVGGRHVGYGDGIYASHDNGITWKKMGLEKTEHISKIIVHPKDSDVLWVAAQGPLWNKGGERGLYKTSDGGTTWKKVLGDDEWVGVTDILLDPRDPDWMYAATWQRHRTVAAYMGGGPGSGIHRSKDGGVTWEKLTTGLPRSNMGKIGLAISPQNPDVVYAAIELDRTTGGVYKSTNRGASWKKMSDAVSGATGPHYYQELYASPHAFDRIYLVDNRIQVSDDGGENFRRLTERGKHSDNHSINFRADDPDYLLVGTDGGIYESFDLAETWRFIDNLPITQYYKVAVDDREPFYHVFGGTQDNGSHGGPSRTDTDHGIRNADWYKTLGADGHQSAVEPGNPSIIYAETQQGGLHRIDQTTGEQVFIQPQPKSGEDYERYNWDAPILVSPHDPKRLYFASQRVWRSDNRGDSWTPISPDLTRDQERITLPIMGKQQSWDEAWDVGAMSNYNTITSLAESPLQEGLIYVGTDDGLIQVTRDGGQNWNAIPLADISGVPSTGFVNDVKADLFDLNTAYVALDNHKYGDFKPYLIKTTDGGKTWTSIANNLPERTLVWRIVQDHVKKDLLFAATEFGIYVTLNGGMEWNKLSGGVPTISFRDLVIQKRENDLVGASFGRGFFILDDYSVLRELSPEALKEEGKLYAIKDALWYEPRSIVSSQGSSHYTAENPPFGAVFTYHLSKTYPTIKSERISAEKKLRKEGVDIPFPGWDALEEERLEEKPSVWVVVSTPDGEVVNRISGPAREGLHRVSWDLTRTSKGAVRAGGASANRGWRSRGIRAEPGTYVASLYKVINGEWTQLGESQTFEVVPLYEGALPRMSFEEMAAYRVSLESLQKEVSAVSMTLEQQQEKIGQMHVALSRTTAMPGELETRIYQVSRDLQDLDIQLNGNQSKDEIGEKNAPTVNSRLGVAFRGVRTTYGPTALHRESLELANNMLTDIKTVLMRIVSTDMPSIESALESLGAPWMEGQPLPKGK